MLYKIIFCPQTSIFSVLSSYVVSFWISCLVCCLNTMNDRECNIVAQKMCNIKVFLYICVTKHVIGVLCLECNYLSKCSGFHFYVPGVLFPSPPILRTANLDNLIYLFICVCIYVRRLICNCVDACLYYFPFSKKFNP